MKPSVGFSYVPSLPGLSSDMYKHVQIDTQEPDSGNIQFMKVIFTEHLHYQGRAEIVSFGLVNIVEGKIFAKNDTTGKPKKIKIIDNFGINTSYNIFADSMKWSPVSMQ